MMCPTRRSTLCTAFLVWFPLLAAAQTVIVESRAGGKSFEGYQEGQGRWWDSVAKSAAAGCTMGVGSRFLESDLNGYADFVPPLPSRGRYEVFVTWGRSGNALRVKYSVFAEDGEQVRYLDQAGWGGTKNPNHNEWHSLGTHVLSPGQARVRVTGQEVTGSPDPKNSLRLYTDAVKFVKVGEAPPGTGPKPPEVFPPTPTRTPIRIAPPPVIPPVPPTERPMAVGPVQWQSDLTAALAESRIFGKPLLIYFHTPQAQGCQDMETQTWPDQGVRQALNRLVTLKVDASQSRDIAREYRIFRVPAVVIVNPQGETVVREMQAFFAPADLKQLASRAVGP